MCQECLVLGFFIGFMLSMWVKVICDMAFGKDKNV